MTWHREPNAIGRTDYISGPYRISPREPESDPASVGYGITQWDVSYDGEPIALENSLAAAKDYAADDATARANEAEWDRMADQCGNGGPDS